jgi:uncharacterized protein (DUF488 family)
MILTIGHSNRSAEEFLSLLKAHAVELIADIRSVPRSRHNPQFNRDVLPETLVAAGIRYLHIPELGGLRHPQKGSVNGAWRNASFRGYADYMQTAAFEVGLAELLQAARPRGAVIMCAEAVPWRCHRSLVADALFARGVPVGHITNSTAPTSHQPPPFARIEGQMVTYPATSLLTG